MLRRQAFGSLTNNNNLQQQNKAIIKQTTATSTFYTTTTTTTTTILNDENAIHKQLTKQQANKANSKKAVDDEFEIFQDKENNIGGGENGKFEIYCDRPNAQQHHHNNNNKKPLQELNINEELIKIDSPMIVDTSLDSIKFEKSHQTTISSVDISEDKDDEDEEEQQEEDDEDDEDIDLIKERKREAQERELILMNCEEYSSDIIKHLKEAELIHKPKANYIKQQQDITLSMRSILVDWLVEVSEEYKLHTETLYLAVNYTDRFLSKMSVLRGKLQLLGTASMYIASKYEEIFPPDISEFVYITDDTYSKQQVLRMEHLILKVLNFQMNAPTANCFLLHYLRLINANKKIEHLARYLAELTLVEAEPFLEYLPSQIATSAIYLAFKTLGIKWTNEINDKLEANMAVNGGGGGELKRCIHDLHKLHVNALQHAQQAIQEKYKQDKFDCVSTIQPLNELILN